MGSALPLKSIHHIEITVGNALQAAYYYWKAFGFDIIGYLGPETGHRECTSYALRQGKITFVITSPLLPTDPRNLFLALHGDSVSDIAFEVEDADAVFAEAVRRGADPATEPTSTTDEQGIVRRAAIRTFGDTRHSFISLRDYAGGFLPGFQARNQPGQNLGLARIDHVVGNVEDQQMERWVSWYERIFGFHQFVSYDDKDISTEFSALRSKVMASENRQIKFPINEPARGRKKSQIQEYIDFHYSAGVQHIAMFTGDIIETITRLRNNGVEFLNVPDSYYQTIWDRVGDIKEDRQKIHDLRILVDRDESGYLLQLFTKPVQNRPTLFLEVIQRRGCESFGKGNFKALFESIEREQAARGNL